MATPDSALGIDVDFDDDNFRNSIKFAMQMGKHPVPARRPIFVKKSTGRVYQRDGQTIPPPRLDRDGKPLDPTVKVVASPDTRLTDVDCAAEVERADAEELPVGNFRPTKVVITLLDVDYEQVKDCRELIYNTDRYLYGYEPEVNGLFGVGIHTIVFYALDES